MGIFDSFFESPAQRRQRELEARIACYHARIDEIEINETTLPELNRVMAEIDEDADNPLAQLIPGSIADHKGAQQFILRAISEQELKDAYKKIKEYFNHFMFDRKVKNAVLAQAKQDEQDEQDFPNHFKFYRKAKESSSDQNKLKTEFQKQDLKKAKDRKVKIFNIYIKNVQDYFKHYKDARKDLFPKKTEEQEKDPTSSNELAPWFALNKKLADKKRLIIRFAAVKVRTIQACIHASDQAYNAAPEYIEETNITFNENIKNNKTFYKDSPQRFIQQQLHALKPLFNQLAILTDCEGIAIEDLFENDAIKTEELHKQLNKLDLQKLTLKQIRAVYALKIEFPLTITTPETSITKLFLENFTRRIELCKKENNAEPDVQELKDMMLKAVIDCLTKPNLSKADMMELFHLLQPAKEGASLTTLQKELHAIIHAQRSIFHSMWTTGTGTWDNIVKILKNRTALLEVSQASVGEEATNELIDLERHSFREKKETTKAENPGPVETTENSCLFSWCYKTRQTKTREMLSLSCGNGEKNTYFTDKILEVERAVGYSRP